jgi:hypothetical protein
MEAHGGARRLACLQRRGRMRCMRAVGSADGLPRGRGGQTPQTLAARSCRSTHASTRSTAWSGPQTPSTSCAASTTARRFRCGRSATPSGRARSTRGPPAWRTADGVRARGRGGGGGARAGGERGRRGACAAAARPHAAPASRAMAGNRAMRLRPASGPRRPAPRPPPRTCAPRTPDGLSILLVADFCVRMTVWSLVDRRCTYLPGPKHATKGLVFDPAGGAMAVLEVGPGDRACAAWGLFRDGSERGARAHGRRGQLRPLRQPGSRSTRGPPPRATPSRHPLCSARSARTGWRCTTTAAAAAGASGAGAAWEAPRGRRLRPLWLAPLARACLRPNAGASPPDALHPPPPTPRFPLDTLDAADLVLSPGGDKLALWDSPLSYKVGARRRRGPIA